MENDDQEESKDDEPETEEDPFSDLPIPKLFKIAYKILSIIKERLGAKELSLRARLDRAHRNIKVKEEFHLHHL